MEAIMKCRSCGQKWRRKNIERDPSTSCPSCGSAEIEQSATSMSKIRSASFKIAIPRASSLTEHRAVEKK
jgi:predicted RNA-binding Zn-ribbon protein involved in translation (DUF1610 family)